MQWIESNPGGGAPIIGFVDYKEEMIEQPNGGMKYYRDEAPTTITVMPARGDNVVEDDRGNKTYIKKGEFSVMDCTDNRKVAEYLVKLGLIMMSDWELHHEYLGTDAPEQIEEIILNKEKLEVDLTPKGSSRDKASKADATSKRLKEAAAKKKAEQEKG